MGYLQKKSTLLAEWKCDKTGKTERILVEGFLGCQGYSGRFGDRFNGKVQEHFVYFEGDFCRVASRSEIQKRRAGTLPNLNEFNRKQENCSNFLKGINGIEQNQPFPSFTSPKDDKLGDGTVSINRHDHVIKAVGQGPSPLVFQLQLDRYSAENIRDRLVQHLAESRREDLDPDTFLALVSRR